MITASTVLILGAGSSLPYGYPLGDDLKHKICHNFVFDLTQMVNLTRGKDSVYHDYIPLAKEFISQLEFPGAPTIDVFLYINKKYKDIGRLAIVFELMKAEEKSELFFPKNSEENWLNYLFQAMTYQIRTSDGYKRFYENMISIITFNYDRSFENYLFECLLALYTSTAKKEEIAIQINKIPIYHVYGQLDPLPWQSKESRKYKEDFSGFTQLSYRDIIAKKNIKIIGDSVETPEFGMIKSKIVDAEMIFFLGFGYDEENLKILNIPGLLRKGTKIFGTSIGLSPQRIKELIGTFTERNDKKGGVRRDDIILQPINCLSFLKSHFH